ncbi:MAG TPA: RNA pseudouridine synthase [candidate division Zixibacteria bacterium]|jgi:23S rRNA pseudouridine1911/1915/1917 synthase|nr:RNA pseudouridine synthase [candidate division Zixibacteria bacterium]
MSDPSPRRLSLDVSRDQSRIRLDRYLICQGVRLSRNQAQRLIDSGSVLVDGRARPPGYLVKPGDRVEVELGPALAERRPPEAEDIPLEIVHEDGDLLVVDKPAGMVVHPAPGNYRGTLVNALLGRPGSLSPGTGGGRPGILHRLDKDTSGLLIVAKNQEAHHRLAVQLTARGITRNYLAVAWGRLESGGAISAPVGRSAFDRKKMGVSALRGRQAVTHYRALENFGRLATLVEVGLETGRTHQIRVHLEHIGHPVVGDPTYHQGVGDIWRGLDPAGRRRAKGVSELIGRQALHAFRLRFIHPSTNLVLEFESPVPPDFQRLLDRLREK